MVKPISMAEANRRRRRTSDRTVAMGVVLAAGSFGLLCCGCLTMLVMKSGGKSQFGAVMVHHRVTQQFERAGGMDLLLDGEESDAELAAAAEKFRALRAELGDLDTSNASDRYQAAFAEMLDKLDRLIDWLDQPGANAQDRKDHITSAQLAWTLSLFRLDAAAK